MRKHSQFFRNPLSLLFFLLLISTTTFSQQWLTPHDQLTTGIFAPENSQPNSTSFQAMIGTTGGTKMKPTDPNYLPKDIIKNIRSFHLMEIDFRHQFVPDDIQGQLKPHTCGCDFTIPSCSDTISCDVPTIGQAGNSSFFEWKERYCSWKQPNGAYKIDEVYASIEAIYTPSPVPVPGTPEDITCSFVKDKGYPNKWYTAEEWGGSLPNIRKNAKDYATSFIASFCPSDYNQPCLVDVLELGSEPWGDDPGLDAYIEISWGVIEAMQTAYGSIDKNGWRMKLSTGGLTAHDPNPGCGARRNQYIEDMVPNQFDVYGKSLRDYFNYISVHNYAFNTNTLCADFTVKEMPESPNGNFLKIKNMKQWAAINMPDARVNATEFGWNSGTPEGYCNYIIGEANQAAYYMRAYLLAARYGAHKAFSYATYDSYVEFIYCSTSPTKGKAEFDEGGNLISDTRQPKLILTALEQSMSKIKDKHFIKVIEENEIENGVMAYLIGDRDPNTNISTPTHLVTWKAKTLPGTTQQNVNLGEDYPTVDNNGTLITLPSTNLNINTNSNYFYLGWKNGAANEGAINNLSNSIVQASGTNSNTANVRLSGLPIVIPLTSNGCQFDNNGNLINCGNPPSSSNCADLQFTGGISQIQVTGLGNSAKVEIIGAPTNWQVVTICDGNCSSTEIIPNLTAGDYAVKVNLFGTNGSYCYKEESINVSAGGNPTNGNVDCNALQFTGDNNQISIAGLSSSYSKVEIIGAATNWQVVTICDGNCSNTQIVPNLAIGVYTIKVNLVANDGTGCYREESITVSSGGNPMSGDVDCNALQFTSSGNQITIAGQTVTPNKIEIIGSGTGWQVQTICNGNCTLPQNISNLTAGNYTVKVLLTGDDGNSCYRETLVAVGSSSNRNNFTVETANLFPNPTSNQVILETFSLKGKRGSIQVYNTFGKLVRTFPSSIFERDYQTIDISELDNGMYFLTVQTDGKPLMTGRFIIENWK